MKIVPDSEPEPRQIPTEYLLDKYETQGMTALNEILRQRAGDASVGFTTWLSRLRTEGAAPAPLVARLKQDVVNSLKATQSPQRFGYKG
jgi:hypothetical protein